jgi:hypothetical protein
VPFVAAWYLHPHLRLRWCHRCLLEVLLRRLESIVVVSVVWYFDLKSELHSAWDD